MRTALLTGCWLWVLLVAAAAQAACPRSPEEDARIVHLLNRAAFGPTEATMEEVRCAGRAAWIEAQLRPQAIDDPGLTARLAAYPALTMDSAELLAAYPQLPPGTPRGDLPPPARVLAELTAALLTRAVHGRAQLVEVLTDFWLNHFNVFAPEGPTKWAIIAYERDAIRPHVLGRFEDLLRASAESAAMLYYLDNYLSSAAGARAQGGGLNENYGRELLELHTLGVNGGYTQDDVIAVARAFTGWTITLPRSGSIEFFYRPAWHDTDGKTVLGVALPPGGYDEGRDVLHLLASHPSTADFIAAKLAARLVADQPPAELVDAARRAYLDSGGDLAAVVRTILTAEVFADARYQGVKVKAPFEFVATALRALSADVASGYGAARLVGRLGQPLLQSLPPTGWPDAADEVVSVGGMLTRFDAARTLAAGTLPGVRIDTARFAYLRHGWRMTNRLSRDLLQRPASVSTQRALQNAARAGADQTTLVALALSSPEFQQQ